MATEEDLRAQYMDEGGAAVDEEDLDNQGLASEEEDDDDVIDLSQAAAGLQGDAATVVLARFFTRRGYNTKGLFAAMSKGLGTA